MHGHTYSDTLLEVWCVIMVITSLNGTCLSLYYHYSNSTKERIKWWRFLSRIAIVSDCIAWSSIIFLILPIDIRQQYSILFILYAVLSGFALGSIPDIVAAIINLSIILVPPIVWPYLQASFFPHAIIGNPGLTPEGRMMLGVYGSFMLFAACIGYYLVKSYITRGFILENVNQTLEQRVQDRTKDLEYQANHDWLTGLPNRRMLEAYIKQTINISSRDNSRFAVFIFGLDRFKQINDNLTHNVGDYLLKALAERLQIDLKNSLALNQQIVENGFIAARMWGDGFAIVLAQVDKNTLENSAKTVFSIMERPFSIISNDQNMQKDFKMSMSMGASLYPDHGADIKTLLMNAETAMFAAKEQGRDRFVLYTSVINEGNLEKLGLMNDLRSAIERNEFVLHYQPVIDLKTNMLCATEALIRWQHPTKGLLYPVSFLGLAEEDPKIAIALDKWVIKTAAAQTKAWLEMGHAFLKIAVNLSFRYIHDSSLMHDNGVANFIKQTLLDTQLDPQHLEIELTEGIACQHVDDAVLMMNNLKRIGVDLAIDDFGTGYSSLSYLKKFPVDVLKIDKSFIDDIIRDDRLVVTIINLSHSYNLKVLAEGVEHVEQLEILKKLGCDMIQGYYYSRPVGTADFARLLEKKIFT
jgi:diguanylate cyclase (GGDEF)-like protein